MFVIITKDFLNISKNPLNISCVCHKNTPILKHLGQNFMGVVRIEQEDSSAIFETCCGSAFSDVEHTFRIGNRWNGLFLPGVELSTVVIK